ncbi:UDP-N-acetylmuramoyl-L-alanyl-D-glutamate--2,6-diaminopimelate ligase [Muribaculum sp. An289]|uniref:UDP-N-acetylmuramoyl-L-alanyl-D-glutamate--2,6-diaminopimelate ligase n=1 Tax=Candidatus Merdivivens faecigallinarum TaxID=2840871 RepID=A0A9D9IZQ5_9BACT|nr:MULTISPECIES: UDP-N-acetylmuramoyl-L-alanyl-D-glutamate--2,6-diaminopimelate ligase [unclassified Muribaculum]MBO8481161.1 UDP-N-acetylmuramoyl-L-alanyl-D-glutamate--2,6-diaminopimelate ligase [Candidatus Merdivivens faecigallinarum]OUO38442.1 UDP-N-acetylmuramoyl-L-alanyl-D-glutamate--2,6-diaminopimelate ligase [Muribaculum sp. An289]OUO43933.1 UDP-N-acetylmuramoyl-L-alanyl-D-glutamate--2,6-diaminopimelate ligase [Muribaculum sp. An287]
MKFEKFIQAVGADETYGDIGTEITMVTDDSRKCVPGALFIAVKGFGTDGHAYIGKAVENGASAIIFENPDFRPEGIPAARTTDARKAVALAADLFYGRPSTKLKLVGITGTNGKTTTATMLYRLFTGMGYGCGLLSTIANYICGKEYPTLNTTSDPITINSLLAEMVKAGCEYCFMEVSSVGIEQERVAGLTFAGGIFSNLTHDHLDYHKTFAEYLRCKKMFFDSLPPDAFALTNIDDRNGRVMVQNTKARVVTYSCRSAADHTCRIIEESFDGMLVRMDGKEVWCRLIGAHNAYNLLAVYSAAVLLGANGEEALQGISGLTPVAGRMEYLRGKNGLTVVIDYAHTPDALENVLKTLRETGRGNSIITVFGCGGDRDRSKRPEMAAVAEKYSDRVFVTSDNPRTEDPEAIINEIMTGFSAEGLRKAIAITDRKNAIRTAVMTAPEGAVILLAGKGHETYQIIGHEKRDFNEYGIVKEILN